MGKWEGIWGWDRWGGVKAASKLWREVCQREHPLLYGWLRNCILSKMNFSLFPAVLQRGILLPLFQAVGKTLLDKADGCGVLWRNVGHGKVQLLKGVGVRLDRFSGGAVVNQVCEM